MKMSLKPKDPGRLLPTDILFQTVYWGRVKWLLGWKPHAFEVSSPCTEGDLLVLTRSYADGITVAHVPQGPEHAPGHEEYGCFLEQLSHGIARHLDPTVAFIRYDLPWESQYAADKGIRTGMDKPPRGASQGAADELRDKDLGAPEDADRPDSGRQDRAECIGRRGGDPGPHEGKDTQTPRRSAQPFGDVWRKTMWLMTTFGFFDVVQEPGEDTLTVRARTRRDLQELRKRHLPELGATVEDVDSDYKYRAAAPRHAVARAVGEIAGAIDYASFRDSVLALQGFRRAIIYARIWNLLWTLQEEEPWFDAQEAEPAAPGRKIKGQR